MCLTMFIAALFVTARTWEQLRCPSAEEWLKIKILYKWPIYTVEYYTAVKINDIFKFACTWTDLENLNTLSEVFHTQKDKYNIYKLTSAF